MASGSINFCMVEEAEAEQLPTAAAGHPIEDSPDNNQTPDYDFVDQPDQDYYCPVSLELLTEPHQTDCCGHHISQQAVDRLLRDKKPCPMCKEDNLATHADKFFKRKVRQLKVRCPYKKSGCEWTGELGDLNQHTTSCLKRSWKCPYCQFQTTHDIGTTDHAPQCDYQPVPCPNHCEVDTVPRCHAEKHLLACPLQLVDCEFASAGCDVKVPRKDMAGHMTESAQHHLMTATLLNLRLTKDLYKKMEEKDKQIAELKQELKDKIDTKTHDLATKLQQQTHDLDTKLQEHMQLTAKLSNFICHSHTLTKFTEHQASGGDGSWYSESFYNYPGGYKFKLNIDTNGCWSAKDTHLTAFLCLLKGNYDKELNWPLKLTVTLDMFNQEEENNDHSTTTEIVFETSGSNSQYKSIGTHCFFPLAQLKEKHYLKNDQVKFRLWLKINS